MSAKRVSLSLTDEEINFLIAAIYAHVGDIAASGDDVPPESQPLQQKLQRARSRVRNR